MIRDCFGASLVDSTVIPRNYSAWLEGANLDRFVSAYLSFFQLFSTNLAATDFYVESLTLSLSIVSSTFLKITRYSRQFARPSESERPSFNSIPDYLVASYAHRFFEAFITRCAASKATPAFPIRSSIEFHCFSESSFLKYDVVDKRISEVEIVVDGYRPGTVGNERLPVVEVDFKVPPLEDASLEKRRS